MTATLQQNAVEPSSEQRRPDPGALRRWLRAPRWRRFTAVQLMVLGLAAAPLLVIATVVAAAAAGLASEEAMLNTALAAGENPGMLVFAAMFLASPVQWLTGRSQIRVRKYLGVTFYLLALSNAAMFVVERGVTAMLGSPFLVAGSLAVALATPLALTSSRWSQRLLGMRRWRLLHRLTYVIAFALVGHVVLIGDVGPGAVLIVLGLVARIPAVRRWLQTRGEGQPLGPRPGGVQRRSILERAQDFQASEIASTARIRSTPS